MEKNIFEEDRYLKAQKRVKEIKGFYWNLFWYAFVNISWFSIVLFLNSGESFFDYGFWGMGYGLIPNIIFWGLGLFAHWFVVFGRHLTFSKSWEERKIKQFMEEENNTKF